MKPLVPVTPADCNRPCVDTWRLEQLRDTAMRAYLGLERRGQIVMRYPVRIFQKSGRVEIRYLAALPHEWTLEELARTEEKIGGGLKVQLMMAL